MAAAITVEGVSKSYRIGEYRAGYDTLRDTLATAARHLLHRDHTPTEHDFWALKEVSFAVHEGEALGIIGRNGSGKSTMLKILSRITPPTSGHAIVRGRVGSLLEVGTGFHPELTGRENVYLNGSILGMGRREVTSKIGDIIEFAGIDEFMDTPVKRYSSGMYVRLAFAVAAHMEPEIMLVDEVLSVGDYEFQRRCMGRMEELSESGRTVVFVSHDLGAVSKLCQRAVLLHGGQVAMIGPSEDVVAHYLKGATGTTSEKTWEAADAPAGERVRLYGVRLVGPDGNTAESVDIRTSFGVEIRFAILSAGKGVFPKIKIVNESGEVVFNAIDTSPRWQDPARPGEYISTAWVPANLLNDGFHSVDAALCSLAAPKLHHHIKVADAVGFHLYDAGEGDSSRGFFTGTWKGAVRPLLDWTTVEER
jgi:lipopolysaccharide transport system ATP-binding protein